MNLKLIGWAPGKRFDAEPKLCSDGRGGWVFSQVNVDRHITDYEDYWLIFYFGVLVESANEQDFVESTHVTAEMHGQEIGSNELEWKRPNPMWGYADGDAIFEFSQAIMMQPTRDGLITFHLRAKLNSQSDVQLRFRCVRCLASPFGALQIENAAKYAVCLNWIVRTRSRFAYCYE